MPSPLSALSLQLGYVEQEIIALTKQVKEHHEAGHMPTLAARGARDVLGHAQLSLAHAAEWVRMAAREVQRSRPKARRVSGSTPRPWDFEVADETRREIVVDINGLRRAANRAVGTVDAIAHRFERRSAERRMADGVLAQVEILRVLAYGWRPLYSAPFEAIAEGTGLANVDGITIQESTYSDSYFRAEAHGRVYILHRETCCPDCADKFAVVMEAGA